MVTYNTYLLVVAVDTIYNNKSKRIQDTFDTRRRKSTKVILAIVEISMLTNERANVIKRKLFIET